MARSIYLHPSFLCVFASLREFLVSHASWREILRIRRAKKSAGGGGWFAQL